MKKRIILITIVLIFICIIVILLNKFNVVDKIKYEGTVITQEEKEQAIATICYTNIIGIDAQEYETCYIYKNTDNSYYYLITTSSTTIAGVQEEKINKKGNINNKNQLEKLINDFENKIKTENSETEYVTITYNSLEIGKEELLNQMFH